MQITNVRNLINELYNCGLNGDAIVTVDTFDGMDMEVVEGKVVFKGPVVEISEATGEAN